jgi:hypothetical protein
MFVRRKVRGVLSSRESCLEPEELEESLRRLSDAHYYANICLVYDESAWLNYLSHCIN